MPSRGGGGGGGGAEALEVYVAQKSTQAIAWVACWAPPAMYSNKNYSLFVSTCNVRVKISQWSKAITQMSGQMLIAMRGQMSMQ